MISTSSLELRRLGLLTASPVVEWLPAGVACVDFSSVRGALSSATEAVDFGALKYFEVANPPSSSVPTYISLQA